MNIRERINEVKDILRENDWHETDGTPDDFSGIDYHRHDPYNRIILFYEDFLLLTNDSLEYLMKTPPEKRLYNWRIEISR